MGWMGMGEDGRGEKKKVVTRRLGRPQTNGDYLRMNLVGYLNRKWKPGNESSESGEVWDTPIRSKANFRLPRQSRRKKMRNWAISAFRKFPSCFEPDWLMLIGFSLGSLFGSLVSGLSDFIGGHLSLLVTKSYRSMWQVVRSFGKSNGRGRADHKHLRRPQTSLFHGGRFVYLPFFLFDFGG